MLGQTFATLEQVYPKSIKFLTAPLNRLIRGQLWLQVLVGMVVGVVAGLLINPGSGFVSRPVALGLAEWLALPGNLFLAFIQMIVVPLILASIIRGIAAATDVRQLKGTGLGLAAYFVTSTMFAAVLGIAIGLTLKPGSYVDRSLMAQQQVGGETQSLIEQGAQTAPQEKPFDLAELPSQIAEVLPTNPMNSIVKGEMLQIAIFAIVLGIGLLSVSVNSSKPLLELLGSIQEICMAIVGTVMTFAPFACSHRR